MDALSRVIAVEEGPRGIRSNVISPGPIGETEGLTRLSSKEAPNPNYIPFPLGRVGHTKDIANAAVFLFSEAAANITGQILIVDGANSFVASFQLPYPKSVFDPESVKHLVPKL